MKRSRPIFGVVLVFILGILCGSLATHLLYKYRMDSIMSGRGQNREEAIVSRLDRKLHLDDGQEEKVRAIVHETEEEIRALRKQLRPQTEAIIEKAQTRISVLLTPEQRTKYDQMIAARKEKLRKRGM